MSKIDAIFAVIVMGGMTLGMFLAIIVSMINSIEDIIKRK